MFERLSLAASSVRAGIVGRIEIEDDLWRRRLVRLEEQGDEQALDRRRVVALNRAPTPIECGSGAAPQARVRAG
jgi:hypothetical protein